MKHRIASLAVGFLSLVLLLQTASAAPVTGQEGESFRSIVHLCEPGTDWALQRRIRRCSRLPFKRPRDVGGHCLASWRYPVVAALTLCGQFNEVDSSITATLDSIPLTAANLDFPQTVPMASIQSSGASNKTQCFTTKDHRESNH